MRLQQKADHAAELRELKELKELVLRSEDRRASSERKRYKEQNQRMLGVLEKAIRETTAQCRAQLQAGAAVEAVPWGRDVGEDVFRPRGASGHVNGKPRTHRDTRDVVERELQAISDEVGAEVRNHPANGGTLGRHMRQDPSGAQEVADWMEPVRQRLQVLLQQEP